MKTSSLLDNIVYEVLGIGICVVWLGLWCEASAPYGASGRKDESLRPSRRSSVVVCLASDRRQDLNGETVAVS